MNINKFKPGDIITRNSPCKYDHNSIKDSSYCGERIILLGVDTKAKIIFFKHHEFPDEISDLSYARDRGDDGGTYYPVKLGDKCGNLLKSFNKPLN